MNIKHFKHVPACLVLVATRAFADGTCDAAPVTVLNPAPIDVPANPAVGQVLGDPNGYAFDIPAAMVCTYYGGFVEYWSSVSMPPDTQFTNQWVFYQGVRMPIYRLGVPGVGFAMVAQDRDGGDTRFISTGTTALHGPIYPGLPSWGYRGRLYFFVTGPIQGGLITARTVSTFVIRGSYSGGHVVQLGSTLVGPPRKPTCSVSTPSVPLSLGMVATKDFKGVGSVAGNATGTIELQCAGGTGANVDVLVTLTDQTHPANRTDRLSLTATSGAKGVAMQLLQGATLIRYGADSSAAGNPNQWLAGSSGNGLMQIPLTARYIQTESLIRPGTANAVATFTLSYR